MDKKATVGVRWQENRSPSPSSTSSYEYEEDIIHYDSKSDDEYMELYHKQVKDSDGFDVDLFPDFRFPGGIHPMVRLLEDEEWFTKVEECAATALDKYNKDNETNLVLVKVFKANRLVVYGIVYYITFEVKDANSSADTETRVFQARV